MEHQVEEAQPDQMVRYLQKRTKTNIRSYAWLKKSIWDYNESRMSEG